MVKDGHGNALRHQHGGLVCAVTGVAQQGWHHETVLRQACGALNLQTCTDRPQVPSPLSAPLSMSLNIWRSVTCYLNR